MYATSEKVDLVMKTGTEILVPFRRQAKFRPKCRVFCSVFAHCPSEASIEKCWHFCQITLISRIFLFFLFVFS